MNRLFTFILTLVFSLQLATAASAEWVVERVSSSVWSSANGADWRDVKVGERFASSTWIQTGQRGQVILARDSERIVFRPGTIATLASQGRNTDVGPVRGSVLISIDPNRRSRTVVKTPHLAAVVLGTVFEVTTTPGASSSVRVDQGRVAVEHGSRRAVLERGQEGIVSANSTSRIAVQAARTTSLVANGSGLVLGTGAPVQRSQADIRATPRTNSRENSSSNNRVRDNNGSGNNGNGNATNGNGSGNNGNENATNGNGSGNNGNGNATNGNGSGNNGNGNATNGNGSGNNGNENATNGNGNGTNGIGNNSIGVGSNGIGIGN